MELDKPITIAVILFAILVLSFYLVLPKYQEFQDLLTKLGQKEAEFEGKSAYFVEVTRVHKELMLYKDSLEKIDNALPKKFSLANMVNLLYKKSGESGLALVSASVSKAASVGTDTGVKEMAVSLQVLGTYESLERLVGLLENSARLIEGENVSFSVPIPTAESFDAQKGYPISLEIKAYSY